ncbi:MAG: DNA translocase FtsK 4TM domain-containing protein, partial [Rhizobiales bacterium]|nr:DNA translocase FtsK 4TM domain-containing protein [Hyphomicrobiales bacterium]
MCRQSDVNHLLWPPAATAEPEPEASMAYDPSVDTDDSAIPRSVRRFLRNRFFEVCGVAVFAGLIVVGISLATWSVEDPSFNHSLARTARNWMGYPGAIIADELMQFFGLAVLLLIAIPMRWAVSLIGHRGVKRPLRAIPSWIGAALAASATLAALPVPSNWALAAGLGGNAGDVLHGFLTVIVSIGVRGMLASLISAAASFLFMLWLGGMAADIGRQIQVTAQEHPWAGRLSWFGSLVSSLGGGLRRTSSSVIRLFRRSGAGSESEPKTDILSRLAPARGAKPMRNGARIEPVLSPRRPVMTKPDEDYDEVSSGDEIETAEDDNEDKEFPSPPVRVSRQDKPIKPGRKLRTDSQPGFKFGKPAEFELPALTLLTEPKRINKSVDLSDEALEQNARMLEGVLEDFGVKGQIVKV